MGHSPLIGFTLAPVIASIVPVIAAVLTIITAICAAILTIIALVAASGTARVALVLAIPACLWLGGLSHVPGLVGVAIGAS
ncbi:MAG: hypothetical protein ABIR05_03150 [Luteimonas sp.]